MPSTLPREHGSERGYQQHHRLREVPCLPCTVAHARCQEHSRNRGRCARGLGWPLAVSRG